MKRNNTALKTAFLASGSFAGYNIGSGFATGVEGQQFFVSWGSPRAFVGILVAMLTTAIVFVPVYLVGFRKRGDETYNVYHYYCGDKLGTVIDWYMYASILLIILTMMSGAGATIHQYFGIPKMVGTLLLSALCILAALCDLKKLMRILSYAGTVIVIFVVCCMLYIRFGSGQALTLPTGTFEAYVASGELQQIRILGVSNPILCGAASAGLLVVSSLPWVASTGALCPDRKTAIASGTMCGTLFYAAQTAVVYLNLICMDEIVGQEVPLLAVFQRYLPALAMVYSGVIVVAIFSTVSGRLFLFADRFDGGKRKRHIVITVITVAAAAVGGIFIPFSRLSYFLFTVSGCLGIFLALVILTRTIWDGIRKKAAFTEEKNEEDK